MSLKIIVPYFFQNDPKNPIFVPYFLLEKSHISQNAQWATCIANVINSNNLFILYARTTDYGLKLLKVSGPFWNLIPNQIRRSQFVCSFRRNLKIHLKKQMQLMQPRGLNRTCPHIREKSTHSREVGLDELK